MSVIFIPPSSAASIADATETSAGKIRIATSAEATAGTNDVTAMTPAKVKAVIDAAISGGVTYRGTFDAGSPADLSNAVQGDLYIISGAGSYAGRSWAVGDHLLVNADMGGTLDGSKIDKIDSTDAVTSVAGRTGAVTLSASDISGLANVATSGAYADLSGKPTLGTAAALDVGTSALQVVQLDASAKLPAVDGSQLTNLPSAPVTSVAGRTGAVTLSASDVSGLATVATSGAYADLSGTPSLATVATSGDYDDLSNLPTLGTAAALDVGTSALQVVQLDASAKLPAVDGSQLTNLPSAPVTSVAGKTGAVTLTASDISGLATVATTGAYSDLSGKPTLGTAAALDVGTSALQVVQLDASAKLPAVDGSQLTNLPSAPVTSVAGRTGAVTLSASDVSGLATVATSGAYADLSGTPSLATVATSGDYDDLSNLPTLGTAAALDVGTSALQVVQLDASAKLPAVDGSQLTNLPSAPVTSVAGKTGAVTLTASDVSGLATVATTGAYSDLSGKPTLGTAAALDVGTTASKVVQLDASARLPAVDGSQLTNLPSAPVTSVAGKTGAVTLTASDISGLATVATTGAYSDLSGLPTLGTAAALDVGTTALKVVQLDASGKLPAVDGSQLTNLPSGGGGTLPSVVTITSTTTLSARSTDELIRLVLINNGSSSVTVTLPSVAAGDVGFAVELKLLGTGAVTIGASGGATIDGGASASLNIQYEARTIRAASTSTWYIV
jgi:trimeric autotransporter adhesin